MNNTMNNQYDQAYSDFNESTLQQRLSEKYAPKAYHVRFKMLRLLALISSYGFNVFSALTASALVYFFVLEITGFQYIAVGATFFFIGILEATKRAISSRLFQNVLQYRKYGPGIITVMIGLMCMSVAFSFYGSKQAVTAFVPAPTLVNSDTLTNKHTEQIQALNHQIDEARNTKYRGTTTRTSQQTIKALTDQKSMLQHHILTLEQRTEKDNQTTRSKHEKNTTLDARYFALFTLILEALFLLSAWYLEYYDFRSYIELKQPILSVTDSAPILPELQSNNDIKETDISVNATNDNNKKPHLNGSEKGAPIDENLSIEVIQNAIKNINGKRANAKYRLSKNIGRKETSERNLQQAETELIELRSLLKSKQSQ